jgi:proteasome lid subunit RPN8/RPN11
MPVLLSSALHHQLLAEAAAAFPHECCGLLFGTPDRIDAARPCTNVAGNPLTTFEIDYHSHPHGHAEPSVRDAMDCARDGRLWLIVAGDTITAWRATEGGALHAAFDPVTILPSSP